MALSKDRQFRNSWQRHGIRIRYVEETSRFLRRSRRI